MAELTGSAAAGRILSAAPIALAEIEARFAERIEARDEITFDAASGSLRGRKSRRLGAIALSDQQIRVEPNEATAKLLAENIARAGLDRLPWSKALTQWRDRVMFLRAERRRRLAGFVRRGACRHRKRMARADTLVQDRH